MDRSEGVQCCAVRPMEGRRRGRGDLQEFWQLDSMSSYRIPTQLSSDILAQMLKITGAGHMVPMDKPKEALTMLNEWLNS